jgi:hypothetical protein
MSIWSKTSDQARSIPYLDGAAIEKLFCLLYGSLIIRALDDLGRLLNVAVLTKEKDSIRPHHARAPAPPVFEFESCTEKNFYASGIARRRGKNAALTSLFGGMSAVECPTDKRASR